MHSDKFSRDERPAGTSSGIACSPEVGNPFGWDNVESAPPFRVYTGRADPQPLSAPFQYGIRFFLHPLPTAPSKRLTAGRPPKNRTCEFPRIRLKPLKASFSKAGCLRVSSSLSAEL